MDIMPDEEWKDCDEFEPPTKIVWREPIYVDVRTVARYRWMPYSPHSMQVRIGGVLGRWQRLTHRGYVNCELPDEGEYKAVER